MKSRRFVFCIYLFSIYLLSYNEAKSYRAVVIIHGVLTGSESMDVITNRIQEVGKITDFYKIPRSLTCYNHESFGE